MFKIKMTIIILLISLANVTATDGICEKIEEILKGTYDTIQTINTK